MSATQSVKVIFNVKSYPSEQSKLSVYIGSTLYNISTTSNTTVTVTAQQNNPLYIQLPIFDGYNAMSDPELLQYNSTSDTINVSVTYIPVNRSAMGKNSTLPGWSKHIAFGNIWNPGGGSSSSAQSLLDSGTYDFLMVYTDLGAAIDLPWPGQSWTDNNQYVFMNQIRNMTDTCVAITAGQKNYKKTCIPMATLYTANLSGGSIENCLIEMGEYSKDPTALMQNLAATASLAYTLDNRLGNQKVYSQSDLPVKGVIVLNPDYISYQYQMKGTPGGSDPALDTYKYNINYVLGFLLPFLETPSSTKGTFQASWNITYQLQGTPLTIQKQSMLLSPSYYEGRYSNTVSYMSNILNEGWSSYRKKYPKVPNGAPLPSWCPKFTDDYNGYIQVVNYLVSRYGPGVYCGWDCGVYFKDTAKNWLFNKNKTEVNKEIENAVSYYAKLPLVTKDVRVSSNFLVFDLASYAPLFDEGNMRNGWLLNGPALKTWFKFISRMTDTFNVPAAGWQISGDPLPALSYMATWMWKTYKGTIPNFIFGNDYSPATSNLNSTFPLTLPKGLESIKIGGVYTSYDSNTTVLQYLNDNREGGNFDWTKNNLKVLYDTGIFAIQFGGTNNFMAGISTVHPVVTNNPFLVRSIREYWKKSNPYPFITSKKFVENDINELA